jgi:signal transduction histidine kinase
MADFYKRALKKLDKLTLEQCRLLLVSTENEAARMLTVLDSLPAGILVCDKDHNLILSNKSARRMLPLSYNDGVKLWKAVRDDRLVDFFKDTLLTSDKVIDREMDILMQGHNRLLSLSIVPLAKEHRVIGSLVNIEDITEKRKEEASLRRAENLASLVTLAAGVAHEIKNPLASISIHIQLLQKAILRLTQQCGEADANDCVITTNKYLNVMNEEITRLNDIVVDFLFAVRPMNLKLREANINTLIAELVDFFSPEMELSNIRCLIELDEKVPKILIDERYIKQALINIIKNAQAAMTNGGLFTVITKYVDNEIRISLIDTGIGISDKNLSKIFEPYFTTKEEGIGLGLTMVYKIIKEHKGEVFVDSREGEGTVFEIVLPIPQKVQRLIEYR